MPGEVTTIEQRVAVAKQLGSKIRQYLGELTPEQWELPSACDEWQIQDVVSHLIGGADRQAESMERGRAGDSNPPEGFAFQGPAERSASNAQRDIQRRNRLKGHFLESFDSSYEKLFQQFDEMAKSSWDTPCWHASRGAMPAAEYVSLRIQELAIHDWDMRSVLETNAELDSESVPSLLEMTPRWLGMCFRASDKLPKPVVYGFEVDSTNYRLAVTGDTFQIDAGDAPDADLTLSATGDQYLLFTYGRLSASDGMHLGKLAVTGEMAHLDQFEAWFKGL